MDSWIDRPVITRREWRNVALFALAVMVLTTLPYLVGALSQRDGRHFGWFLFGLDDDNSYLAKMREGGVDGWLFHLTYTSEPHDGAFLFTPYLAMGKIAAIIAPPSTSAYVDAMLLVFHVARLIFGLLLILVMYRFIAAFIRKRSLRWLALILVCLGGGFGWLLIMTGQTNLLGSLPVDVILPEGYTFYLLFGLPHLSLARAALLFGLLLAFRALTIDSPRKWLPYSLLAGLCWIIVGLCVPFYIGVLYAILGVWGLAALIRFRRFPFRLFWRCLVAAILPLPLLLYSFYVFSTNKILGAWSVQNSLPSPNPLHYVLGYGVLAILALPAIRWAWRRGRRATGYLLLAAWVVSAPVLAYLPINVQRRMLEAIFVPLSILATMGLRLWLIHLRRRYHRRIRQRRAVALVLALTLPTTFVLLLTSTLGVRDTAGRLYHTDGEIAAMDWLNTHAPQDAIALTSFDVGNYLPARTSLRSFIGHGPETINLGAKEPLSDRYFAGQMTADERRTLYNTYNIRYVIATPDQHFAATPDLKPLFAQDGYAVYEVLPS